MRRSRLLSLWLILLAVAAHSAAQVDTGSILGTVKDPSGGVLPGAAVTLTHKQTGIATRATTDARGYYSLDPGPGIYKIFVVEGIFNRINGPELPISTPPSVVYDFALQEWV